MDVPHIFGAEINMLHERNVRLAETLQGKPSAENARSDLSQAPPLLPHLRPSRAL